MLSRFNVSVMAAVFGATLLVAQVASAQGDEPEEEAASEEEGGTESGTEDEAEAEEEAQSEKEPMTPEEELAVEEALAADSPVELPGKTYYLVGLRYRGIIVPNFMISLFGDGGDTVYVDAFGPELGVRKDGFEYLLSLWWADYGMDWTKFKASDDDEPAWELVKSEINMMYITADFLWSHDFSPEFALNYGMGAGFGLLWGPLYRVQAYRTAGGDYERCLGENNPSTYYCGTDNDHYGDYEEPSWADGGSKPVIFPWLALQTGFRIKPHRNFVGRVDLGFGTSGFFFGLGADYGI